MIYEADFVRSGGFVRTEIMHVPHRDQAARIGGVYTVVQDITARKLSERELAESEQRFRSIANSAPVPMWVSTFGGAREFVNSAYRDFLGVSLADAMSFDWREALRPDEIHSEFAVEAIATPVPRNVRAPRRVIVSVRDVTERRRLEQQLQQSQKMEAVGQLTGSVAHDFNNLLTLILGGLDVIGRHIPHLPTPTALARVERGREMALDGVKRAVSLTSRLLAFSRQQSIAPRAIDANQLVNGLCELLSRTLGEAIHLETMLAEALWPTFADSNQLESALLNLALNAPDAMPEGGRLVIETANVLLDSAYVAALNEPIEAGQYVMIAVTDKGIGMDRRTRDRAFDPFFTTKELGKGTGLGLSQVFGFARQSSGHVNIFN